MARPNKIEVRAQADGAEILIYDRIGESFWDEGLTAKQFRQELKALGEVPQLNVRINSPGGSMAHGLAIYETLREHSARKVVHIDGWAASMASIIAMAGDEILIAEAALVMIHDPFGYAEGSAEDLRRYADMMDKSKSKMVAIYAGRTKLAEDEIGRMMAAETWLDANEAIEKGFANKLSGQAAEALAEVRLDGFRNVPKWVRDMCARPPEDKAKENTTMSTTPAPAATPEAPKAATLEQLEAACEGATSEFLLGQLKAKATVEAAIKAYNVQLKADAEAAKKELAESKTKPTPAPTADGTPKKPGVAPVNNAPDGGKPEGDVVAEVERRVSDRMKASGEPRHKAFAAVMRADEDLREKYRVAKTPS